MSTLCLLLFLQAAIPQRVNALTHDERVWLTLQATDCVQTREIISNNDFVEDNPLLKGRTNLIEIDVYFLLTSFGAVAIKRQLPKYWQSRFIYVLQGLQLGYVSNNVMAGIGVKF